MAKSISHLSIVAGLSLLLLLESCRSSTWVGGQACYPAEAERESADFCLFVNITGGAGKAYVDRSPKSIRLDVENRQKQVVLKRDYSAEAGDLRWMAIWPERSALQVIFFEYDVALGKGQPAKELSRRPRQILSLAFTFDESKGSFVEAPAPAAVLHKEAEQDAKDNQRHAIGITFTDSPQAEAQILQTGARLAAVYSLEKHAPEPGYIGLLAKWFAKDLRLDVVRDASSKQLSLSLDDYGRREISENIASEFRQLPGVVATRRSVGVNFRAAAQARDSVIQNVEIVANKYGLHRTNDLSMFDVAKFEAENFKVSVGFFDLDSKFEVSIEDLGWHAEFHELEQALRSRLSAQEWN